MPSALSLAPLTLAAVLVLSGIAKLPDPSATASMIRLLRLPSVVHPTASARALPYVELATAALLLTPWRWTYAVGAVLAAGLFVAFLLVVVRAMGFDPRPTCGCFGRVGDHRINGRTVIRNVLLVALAGVALAIAVGGRSAGGLVADYSTGDWTWLLLAVALAAVAVLVLGAAPGRPRAPRTSASRSSTDAGRAAPSGDRPTAAAAGTEAEADDYVRAPIPAGVVVDSDLQTRSLRSLIRSQAQLVVLVNCWCGPTFEVADRLGGWRERLPQLGVQLVHTHAPWDDARFEKLSGTWWDPGSQLYTALQAGSSPAAVLLGADGLLAGGPVNGVDEIETFVSDIEAQLSEASVEA